MKGNITGLFIGIVLYLFCFFLVIQLPIWIPDLAESSKTLLFLLLNLLGFTAIIAGILYKK